SGAVSRSPTRSNVTHAHRLTPTTSTASSPWAGTNQATGCPSAGSGMFRRLRRFGQPRNATTAEANRTYAPRQSAASSQRGARARTKPRLRERARGRGGGGARAHPDPRQAGEVERRQGHEPARRLAVPEHDRERGENGGQSDPPQRVIDLQLGESQVSGKPA